MATPKNVRLSLTATEVRLLVQSLGQCIATCKQHQHDPKAACPDCDTARALRDRLEKTAAA
jgi:hypothetical protein